MQNANTQTSKFGYSLYILLNTYIILLSSIIEECCCMQAAGIILYNITNITNKYIIIFC